MAFDDGPFDLARKIARRLLVLALLENDGVLVQGTSVLDAFDRLEVLEATAEMGLFFTPRSTLRSLPSRASVRCCALGSSSQPRFGGYNDRSRVVMRSAEDQKVQAAQQSSFPVRRATPRLCNALSLSACEAPAPEMDSF